MMGHNEIDPTFKKHVRDDRCAWSVKAHDSRMRGIMDEIIECFVYEAGGCNDHHIGSSKKCLVSLRPVKGGRKGYTAVAANGLVCGS